jgi:FlaA1/EpsC-like NDP-sugar epimerase
MGLDNFYSGKVILVTGGAGSIGNEIVRKLIKYKPHVVRILDNNETALFELKQELRSESLRLFVGDIREVERCERAVEDVDIVFHAAALKHVHLCEYNPFEAVKTNVLGTQNIVEAAMAEEVDKVITISTDKAVNPTNVLGATKLLAERLTISANSYKGKKKTVFSCVRFGNVLNSRGSVVPVLKKQIKAGGPVTITNPNMTRFIMSIYEATDFILKCGEIAMGGEIFVLRMPAVRITDLAEVLIEEFTPEEGCKPKGIRMEFIGSRPGEKLHEELLSESEIVRSYKKNGILIVPSELVEGTSAGGEFSGQYKYMSNNTRLLAREEIKKILKEARSLNDH